MLKFIATGELGRLVKWLRILGYDIEYYAGKDMRQLIVETLKTNRIILTRDSKLLRFSGIKIVHIKSDLIEKQIAQVVKDLDLKIEEDKFFSLCVLCNKELIDIKKEEVEGYVPEYVFSTENKFRKCPSCGRIYWQGTHWTKIGEFVKGLKIKNE